MSPRLQIKRQPTNSMDDLVHQDLSKLELLAIFIFILSNHCNSLTTFVRISAMFID